MTQKIYIVEGRQFRSEADYQNALKDQQVIENLRMQTKKMNLSDQKKLLEVIRSGKCRFHSILGQDYMEELAEEIRRQERKDAPVSKANATKKKELLKKPVKKKETPKRRQTTQKQNKPQFDEQELDKIVKEELKKREKRRKLLVVFCGMAAIVCLGYFGVYNWYNYRTADNYKQLSELKDKEPTASDAPAPVIHYTAEEGQSTPPPVLDEYKNLLNKNKRLIGWVKIDDTNIDYPVMQTTDNEYYLDHGFDGQEFRAGTVFMDCTDSFGAYPDQWSENIVLYGHNMADNTMFGSLRQYRQNPSYYKEAPFITFSSNYADYTYVMVGLIITSGNADSDFKYWQMEELDDKTTFDSFMGSVNAKNMIDNPIDVQYGDSLLTLSTCYSDEDNSRFVIVARRLRDGEDTASMLKTIQGGSSETAAAQE